MARRAYRSEGLSPLERAVVDLVRVGAYGDGAAVRQLGRRLIRTTPDGVSHPAPFRDAVGQALADAPTPSPLRFASMPADAALRAAVSRDAAPTAGVTASAAPRTRNAHAAPAVWGDAGVPGDVDNAAPLVLVEQVEPTPVPVLEPDAAGLVDAVVRERRERDRLARAGLEPSRTVLLSGPPGVGKTLTARYLAGVLDLPLVRVDLASVMSSYLGRTGQNVRAALAYARSTDCVVLLDEFDALAKRRDDQADVGELKRLVNVLLLELEQWPARSLLVAATNHPDLLDHAVARRFDVIAQLRLPGFQERQVLLERLCADLVGSAAAAAAVVRPGDDGVGASTRMRERSGDEAAGEVASLTVPGDLLQACALASEGMSGSDLTRLVRAAARDAVLRRVSLPECLLERVAEPLRRGTASGRRARDAFCAAATGELGWSLRRTAAFLGVSHPTVRDAAARWRAQQTGADARGVEHLRRAHPGNGRTNPAVAPAAAAQDR